MNDIIEKLKKLVEILKDDTIDLNFACNIVANEIEDNILPTLEQIKKEI